MGQIIVRLPEELEKELYEGAERRFGRSKIRARGISLIVTEAVKEYLSSQRK